MAWAPLANPLVRRLKRVLLSNDFYPAIIPSNVDLVTSGIREVREDSIVSDDGVETPVDTLIFGTGFQVTEFPLGQKIFAAVGRSLETEWAGTPKAFLGVAVHGFPNFFYACSHGRSPIGKDCLALGMPQLVPRSHRPQLEHLAFRGRHVRLSRQTV